MREPVKLKIDVCNTWPITQRKTARANVKVTGKYLDCEADDTEV